MNRFSRHFSIFMNELNKERYQTHTIHELLMEESFSPDPRKVHVGLRFDVDSGLELCAPLAEELAAKKVKASFYFLTHPERYYDIWNSQVPRLVSEMGFEVGVHSDHYYEKLISGGNAISRIKNDVKRLSDITGSQVRGITAHGHYEIARLSNCIWDLYKDLAPHELGLEYHDETLEKMIRLRSAITVQDYMGVTNGWRYWPAYPKHALKRVRPGTVVFFMIHPHNFFVTNSSKTVHSFKDFWQHAYYFIRIRLRHQLVGAIIGEGKSARYELKKFFRLEKTRSS